MTTRTVRTMLGLVLAALPAAAAERVLFEDGRVLEVARWEADGDWAVLDLDGGGRIMVPMAGIVDVERVPDPPPPAALVVDPHGAWRVLAGNYADRIADAAVRHGLEPSLLAAMAKVESNFDPYAVSHKGACGILQLLPETAERFGVRDLFDVEQNLEGGARYMRWLLDRFDGDTRLALAGYNAGERAVERYGGIPPYPETMSYVARVMKRAR